LSVSGFRLEPVRDVRVSSGMRVCELVEAYGAMHGFMASRVWEAVSILREGLAVSDLRILSFTGNIVATGLRGVLAQLVRGRLFNLLITTTGALDHDIARALGGVYYKGFSSRLTMLSCGSGGSIGLVTCTYLLRVTVLSSRCLLEGL
jgi:deoxyhypusine synthase